MTKHIRPPALCYVPDRDTGFKVLSLYHAGLFTRGIEKSPDLLEARFEEMLTKMGLSFENASETSLEIDAPCSVLSFLKKIRLYYRDEKGEIQTKNQRHLSKPQSSSDCSYEQPKEVHSVEENIAASDSEVPPTLKSSGSIPESQTGHSYNDTDYFLKSPSDDAEDFLMSSLGNTPETNNTRYSGNGTPLIKDLPKNQRQMLCTQGSLDSLPLKEDLSDRHPEMQNKADFADHPLSSVDFMNSQLKTADLQNPRLKTADLQNPEDRVQQDESEESSYSNLLHNLYSYYGQIVKKLERSSPGISHQEGPPIWGTLFSKRELPPLQKVYPAFFENKYGLSAARNLSRSSRNATTSAYQKLEPFYERSLDEISVVELQNLVNQTAASGYSHSAVSDLVTLIRQLYRFAYPREMCTKEYGKYIAMPSTEEEVHHQDFTDDELRILWRHKQNPVIRMILIMCYSGFRIGEFAPGNEMQTVISPDGKKGYFRGGIKTKAGKNRIVPIHSAILPLIKEIQGSYGQPVYLCGKSANRFRDDMKKVLVEIGIDTDVSEKDNADLATDSPTKTPPNTPSSLPATVRRHTPHSCRHTFSRLCESYGVSEADRKRLLGHTFGTDITNGVYGHRSVEELSRELEKIKVPPV